MENSYTKKADALLENGIKSKQDLLLASELKTLSANHKKEMRPYNNRLKNLIKEHLVEKGILKNSTLTVPLVMIAEELANEDKLFYMFSAKKRQSLINQKFPEIMLALKPGITAFICGFSRNIDMGKVGKKNFCFSQIVSNITSYVKYILNGYNEIEGKDFCREENTFSCTVT